MNTLLQNCRYYHGEAECPFQKTPTVCFWQAERAWINPGSERNEMGIPVFINTALQAYFDAGLSVFNLDDDTPISLKAVLFHYMPAGQNFEVYYADYMSNSPSN